VFKAVGRDEDLFDFYPGKLEGFIESCVLASQRKMDSDQRAQMCLHDIHTIADMRIEENAHNDMFPKMMRLIVHRVIAVAEAVNDYVYREMLHIHETLGPFSVDSQSFQWTGLRALKVRVVI
jgi:hypothetical protein